MTDEPVHYIRFSDHHEPLVFTATQMTGIFTEGQLEELADGWSVRFRGVNFDGNDDWITAVDLEAFHRRVAGQEWGEAFPVNQTERRLHA